MKFKNVHEVMKWRLCVGCGTCAAVCPEDKIRLVDFVTEGIRPVIDNSHCGTCLKCVQACPGLNQVRKANHEDKHAIAQLTDGWGTILEVWEGYASDPEIRYKGSSGGAASALALHCIEKAGMAGVIHAGTEDGPLTTRIQFSKTRERILASSGSRYAPASPCAGLRLDDQSRRAWVFIGKPCDVAGVRKAQKSSGERLKNIGVLISIFCAGTPSTQGTRDLLARLSISAETVRALRYRGEGWPGNFSVSVNGASGKRELKYREAWGFLQQYRPYRCYLCPDGTGEFADISCGDPWYREIKEGEQGHSLILIRTERGRQILQEAINAGALVAARADFEILMKSQVNLLGKRAAVWGRLLAFRLLGLPTPAYTGFPLFQNWLTLPAKEKARSIVGTTRRIIARKYYKPLELT